MVLTLLALVIAALAGSAVFIAVAPLGRHRSGTLGCAALCGVAVLLALLLPFGLTEPDMLVLPFGPVGAGVRLILDPLGAGLLVLTFLAGLLWAVLAPAAPRVSMAAVPMSCAAIATVLLAGDATTLLLALLLVALCGWGAQAVSSAAHLQTAALGILCLIAAFAIGFPGGDFAAWRSAAPDGWRADAVFLLALAGVGLQFLRIGHGWLAACVPAVALYLLLRLLFDLGGAVQPLWWGVLLCVLGATASVAGSLRAALAIAFDPVVAAGSLQQCGLALLGLGVALAARAADQPGLAALALTASWLQVVSLVIGRTLLLACAAITREGAGTRRLDRLGGLIHRMPTTATATLAGLFGVVALPPGLGFAGAWLLFQSLLGAVRIGGFGLQLLLALVVAAFALSSAVSVLAAVRLFGVAFLGRPRTPRAAVAEETTSLQRRGLLGGAALVLLLGLAPTLALFPIRPALAPLANAGPALPGFSLVLTTSSELPGYSPLATAALLTLVAGGVQFLLRRRAVIGERREALWADGFAAPPAWLPFGDPVTQYGAASFVEPLRRSLSLTELPRWRRFGIRHMTVPAALRRVMSPAGWLIAIALIIAIWVAAP